MQNSIQSHFPLYMMKNVVSLALDGCWWRSSQVCTGWSQSRRGRRLLWAASSVPRTAHTAGQVSSLNRRGGWEVVQSCGMSESLSLRRNTGNGEGGMAQASPRDGPQLREMAPVPSQRKQTMRASLHLHQIYELLVYC